ncbi:MAG: YHS domain-containing (seleno)protein [Alphaproteobacteria bacterium]|jgi:YHS domain-containing protein|nr:hypothetical protein [Rhodospirillaceae bacterium]MDG2482655.1 YHS domain-containing (seleno)protein [Alphaproteobacteria bacterium]MBT6204342.1 hypothetical protein [Rhodospirillaceae bacterium]MBT6509155.1 hypothetical protein [Rhodospirillaceae bacterium]MBT7614690.1 hypothetical protein [Rhodospirillaceae bacterium]
MRRFRIIAGLAVMAAVAGLVLVLTNRTANDGDVTINRISSEVAIKGYDPVAYFLEDEPTPGDSSFQAQFNGATYQFASAENQSLFEAEPASYAPAYGGYCSYGVR